MLKRSMSVILLIGLLIFNVPSMRLVSASTESIEDAKVQTVITTDGEVDDMNSFIRALYYANEMDIKGIVITSSVYHYAGDPGQDIEPFRWTGTDWVFDMIDAYDAIYPNLSIHADGYPTAEELKEITKIGNIKDVGEMEEITEGSEFLKELFLDGDANPLYVQTWGGTNTTARALKSIEEEYSDTDEWEEIKQQVYDRVVLYIILDQDDSYSDYIQKSWPNLRVMKDTSNFWRFAYLWKMNNDEVNTHLQGEWNRENIQTNHGPLLDMYALMGDGNLLDGELPEEQRGSDEYLENNPEYNQYDFISEGDSPSFFYLFNNGLRNYEDPTYGGWGGRFKAVDDTLNLNTALDYNPYSERFEAEYTLTRWFDDIQNDFAMRADWGVTPIFEDANHLPNISIEEGIDIEASIGEEVTISANVSDPDGDELTYQWWHYFEASTYSGNDAVDEDTFTSDEIQGLQYSLNREVSEDDKIDSIELHNADTTAVTFTVPEDAKVGDTIHIILEVSDSGEHEAKAYQRVIITVR